MQTRPVPERVFRAHANTIDPLEPSSITGGYRFDDFRSPARFHVIYVADSVEGCFIEKLQKYRGGSNAEAMAILAAISLEPGEDPVIPAADVIPADMLRHLAASMLRVIDPSRVVAQIDSLDTLDDVRALSKNFIGEQLPALKPGDVLRSDYKDAQKVSAIIFDTGSFAGTCSRSSLDGATDEIIHLNFNFYRETPEKGSRIFVGLERVETHRALDRYQSELAAAITHLGAQPALPLDHPDLAIH